MKKTKTKLIVIISIIVLIIFAVIFFSRESVQRALKDVKSDFTGGLQRTVTVYDYNGKAIETYKGKIDVEEKEDGNTTKFDLNGKRTIIKGGIVIIQED